ncbi:hypothetical protein K9M09_02455 [Patescibacteria group bacterium]|nr:hypothetical protein [Patescibacteria group bacterium]
MTKKIIWWRALALTGILIGPNLLLGIGLVKVVISLLLVCALSWRYQISANNKEALNGLIVGMIFGFFPLSVRLDGNIEVATYLALAPLIVFIISNGIRHALLKQTRNTIFVPNALISFFLLAGIGMKINAFLYTLLLIMMGVILPHLIVNIGKIWRARRHYARLTKAIKRNHG